jgi:hypothetical protein
MLLTLRVSITPCSAVISPLDFSSRKLAENLYGFRDRIYGFPKEFMGKGRNGARFFENRMFACILRADATPPPHRGC